MPQTASAPQVEPRPLRIALLSYRSNPFVGGQGIYIHYLSQALSRLGHQVDVLSGPPYPKLSDGVRLIKIPSLDLYEHYPRHIRALRWKHLKSLSDTFEWWSMATGGFAEPYTFGRRIVKYLEAHRQEYDIVHDNQSLGYGLLKLQKMGVPVLATIHHPITRDRQLALHETSDWGARLLVKRWYSFLRMQIKVAQKLDHVITVSECSRADIAKEFGRPAERTEVISNGIDTDLFAPSDKNNTVPFRLITTSSSDQALKGVPVLLHALKDLRQHFPDVHLRIIGKLSPNGSNEKLLKQLGLEDVVTFKHGIGHQQLTREYAKAAVAVCPSLYEGFGLPAGEAMSCGVPLVSSDGGALAEVVGDAGLLVPAGDSTAMADAISQIFNDETLAKRLSKLGRDRIQSKFCWQRVASSLTEFYRVLLQQQLTK